MQPRLPHLWLEVLVRRKSDLCNGGDPAAHVALRHQLDLVDLYIGAAALLRPVVGFFTVEESFDGFLAKVMTLSREQKPLLPAFAVFVMLVPGVVLQSVGASAGSLMSWLAGTAAGAFVGVAAGVRTRSVFSTPEAESSE